MIDNIITVLLNKKIQELKEPLDDLENFKKTFNEQIIFGDFISKIKSGSGKFILDNEDIFKKMGFVVIKDIPFSDYIKVRIE